MPQSKRVERPLLGAHISISGGLAEAIRRGREVGCECIQIFTKSARQWAAKPLNETEVKDFRSLWKESGIRTIVAHDSYLLNLGASDQSLRKRSVAAFIDELERCERLGVPFLIAHPGAHMGAGEEAGIRTIAQSINESLAACAGYRVRIALENTAGQGSVLGYRFEQLAKIISLVKEPARLCICFDTEHAFAAGYDIRTREGYERTMEDLDRAIGVDRVMAFHLNDSLKPFNSRVDRHTHIGKGYIGLDAFRFLLNDRRFSGLPMCLETPKGPDLKEDRENLAVLRALFET